MNYPADECEWTKGSFIELLRLNWRDNFRPGAQLRPEELTSLRAKPSMRTILKDQIRGFRTSTVLRAECGYLATQSVFQETI